MSGQFRERNKHFYIKVKGIKGQRKRRKSKGDRKGVKKMKEEVKEIEFHNKISWLK